jgi:hypothetical protein
MTFADLLMVIATTEALAWPMQNRALRVWSDLVPEIGNDDPDPAALRGALDAAAPSDLRKWAYRFVRAALCKNEHEARAWDVWVTEAVLGLGESALLLGFGESERAIADTFDFADDAAAWRAMAVGVRVATSGNSTNRARLRIRVMAGELGASAELSDGGPVALRMVRAALTEEEPLRLEAWRAGGGD